MLFPIPPGAPEWPVLHDMLDLGVVELVSTAMCEWREEERMVRGWGKGITATDLEEKTAKAKVERHVMFGRGKTLENSPGWLSDRWTGREVRKI